MRDPFFAHLMYLIEHMISLADREAEDQGLVLKDSQIQSALTKARGMAQGKSPKIEESTPADRILRDLILSIHHAPKDLMEQSDNAAGESHERPLQRIDWIMAIEAVIDSLKTRRSDIPGSRHYLDFVREFILRAKNEQ